MTLQKKSRLVREAPGPQDVESTVAGGTSQGPDASGQKAGDFF